MKQTNNAIKFLMAQYRAIFKNAYFKGLTSAVLLTAGLTVAGGAQADNLDDASWLSSADHENIVIAGDDPSTGELEYLQIRLTPSSINEWNNTVTIEGGVASNAGGTDKNYLTLSGDGDATLSGTGSLIINSENTTDGLAIASRFGNGDISINIHSIDVKNGTLLAEDVNHGKSGAITIAADKITVGGNGIEDGTGATAIVNLTATNTAATATTLTLGHETTDEKAGSTITVNEGGLIKMAAATSGSSTIKGALLSVADNGLITTTGGTAGQGKNTISSDVVEVNGGFVVGGETVVDAKETTINGNLLISGGNLTIEAEATEFEDNLGVIKTPGQFTLASGSNTQLKNTITVTSGTLTVADGATLLATEAANGSNTSGSIVINGGDANSETSISKLGNNAAKLEIGSETLKSFLNGGTKYGALSLTDGVLSAETDETKFDTAAEGATLLYSGGHIHLTDTDTVDLAKEFYFSGAGGTTSATAGLINVSGTGFISAENLAVSEVLKSGSASNAQLAADINLYLDADNLSLGNANLDTSAAGYNGLMFKGAEVHNNLNLSSKGDTFVVKEALTFNREFFEQQPEDPTKTHDTLNTFVEREAGTITGDNITLGDSSPAASGTMTFNGGKWYTDRNIDIVSGSLVVNSAEADLDVSSRKNNGNPTYVTLDGTVTLSGANTSHASITVSGASGADATLDIAGGNLNFANSGSITLSGDLIEYSSFNSDVVNDFYAERNTRGKLGWGKLLINGNDFDEFFTTNKVRIVLDDGGYLGVTSTTNTGEYDFSKFVSGSGEDGKIAFNGDGVLDVTGTLRLRNPSKVDFTLDIDEGTIVADSIALRNEKVSTGNKIDDITLKTGIFEVSNGLTANSNLIIGGADAKSAKLQLVGTLSDSNVLSQGAIDLSNANTITLDKSGAIAINGGEWSTTADIKVSGVGASVQLQASPENIEQAKLLSENSDTDVYAAVFKADNFASTITGEALSVTDYTQATFNSMQLDSGSSVNVTGGGHVVVNGVTAASITDNKDAAYSSRNTAGVDFNAATVNVTGAGSTFEFEATAAKALIQSNVTSTSGWKTDSRKENKSDLAISNAIADTKFVVKDFGELKFNLDNTFRIDKYDAQFLASVLLRGDSTYNNDTATGYLNLGDAELEIPSLTARPEGGYQVAWDEVADFTHVTGGKVTINNLKQAVVTGIDGRNDRVQGHYGALQVNADGSTLTINGPLGLHNADLFGGYFVFSGEPNSENMEVVNLALRNGADLELENGGKIGAITGNDAGNGNGNTVVFHGNGTTEVMGAISQVEELIVNNNTIVHGDVDATNLKIDDAMQVGANNEAFDVAIRDGYITSLGSLTATNLDIVYDGNNGHSFDVMGQVDLSGKLTVGSNGDFSLVGGTALVQDLTLAGTSSAVLVGYEPDEGAKDDPETIYDDTKSYTGFLEVTGTTELNGGILAVDPDYSQHAAMASLNKLSHSAASLPDLQAGSLDGHLYVGQNAALGIGSDSLATLQAKVAKFQNANGAFNPNEIGSIVYLGDSFDVANNAGLILTAKTIAQFMADYNQGNAPTASDFGVGTYVPTLSNTVYLGANTALLIDADVMAKADTKQSTTEAVISFSSADKGTVIADGGDIIIDGDVRASTYQVFDKATATISYLDGTSYAEVKDSKAAHYEDNINVSTENDFLQGVVQNDGTVTLGVNPNGRAIMHGASNPVYESLVAYARGYNGPEYKPEDNEEQNVEPEVKEEPLTTPTTTPVTDNGIQGVEDSRELYSYNAQGDRVYGQYSNYFLQETISTGDGSAAEAVARLAVFGGAAQAAISAGASTYDAVSGRMGVGANGANITVADNTQGAALWLAPIYKSSDSDGFDAEGVDYGVDMNLYGVALGADYTLSNGIRFGAMFNVGSGDIDGQGAGSAVSNDFDYYGFAVYGGYSMGALSVVADVSYTVADNDLEGNTSIDKVGASLDSTNLSVGVTGQYQLEFSGATVTPHAGLRFSRIDLDDYTVDGEDVIADYDADSMNIFSIPVGVTFAKEFTGDAWTVKPSLDLTLTGNFGDDETDGTVHWAGVENLSTNVSSEVIDNFTYGATLGVAAKTGNFSLGLGVNYTGSSNVDEFGVQANARFVF